MRDFEQLSPITDEGDDDETASRAALCACKPLRCCRRRATVPLATDQADRALSAGWEHRHRRAALCAETVRAPGPAGRRRQSRWRVGNAWRWDCSEVAERRLHA